MDILTLVVLLGGFIDRFEVPLWVMVACATSLTLGKSSRKTAWSLLFQNTAYIVYLKITAYDAYSGNTAWSLYESVHHTHR